MIIDVLTNSFIRIKHDDTTLMLLVTWVGRQTETSVTEGCWKIHEAMLQYQSFHILNDNRHVVGEWHSAAAWVGNTWLPRMKTDGLKRFAWVQSALEGPRASTKLSLAELDSNNKTIIAFKNIEPALAWLMDDQVITNA